MLSGSIFYAVLLFLAFWSNEDVEAGRWKRSIPLSLEDIKEVVDTHNDYRREEGASNMQKLVWSDTLAGMASDWSDRCLWEHGLPPRPASGLKYDSLGQNIAYNMKTNFGLPTAVQLFMSEKENFDYEGNTCKKGKTCTHFKQVAWAKTVEMGCSISRCSPMKNFKDQNNTAYFFGCYYGPRGNIERELLYKKGPACSECNPGQICEQDLCSDP